MGFDPRHWRPPAGSRPVTANLDGLLAENEALRREVRQLRLQLEQLRQPRPQDGGSRVSSGAAPSITPQLVERYDQQSQDPKQMVTADNYKQRLIAKYGYEPERINEDRPRQILGRFPLQDPRRAPEQVGSVMSHYNPAVGINNCLYLHIASAFRRLAKVPVYQFEFADPKALVLGVGIAAEPNPGMEFGAVHSAALNYLFPNLSNTQRIDAPDLPANSQLLAGQMQDMVASFATRGAPVAPGLPVWPIYNSGRDDVMLLVPKRSALHDAEAAHFCSFWRQLYPDHLGSP